MSYFNTTTSNGIPKGDKMKPKEEISNTGKVCARCNKKKGLHQTDEKGKHLFCYMDDSSYEFEEKKKELGIK